MWHKKVHRSTNSFPVKCPGSSYTSCPLFLLSRTRIPEGSLTIERCVKIAAPEVTVTVRLWIGLGRFGILIQNTRKKHVPPRTSGFAYICKKSAVFHLRQGLKLCFPLFGKTPLKRSHFSKAPVFTCSLTSPVKHLIVKWKQSILSNLVFDIYLADLTSQGGPIPWAATLAAVWPRNNTGVSCESSFLPPSSLQENNLAVAKCEHWCVFTCLDCFQAENYCRFKVKFF